jgi:hypothetical protein
VLDILRCLLYAGSVRRFFDGCNVLWINEHE